MSWPAEMLGDLVDIKGGGTPSKSMPEYWGGTIPWASVKDLKSGILERTEDCITELAVRGSSTNVIPAGNIIVPTRMALGKVAINKVDMAINQDLKALQIRDESKLLIRYLFRFLESKAQFLEEQGKGATVKGITLNVLRDLEISLPPLTEQKRIAAILDKADAIRRKRQQAIQLADDFLRAVFLDMFGDPVTNPKGWLTLRVDNLCAIVRGSSPRPQGDPRFYGGPVPRLMVADLTRDGKVVTPMIDSLTEEGAKKSRPIEAGTVVMAVSGNVGLTSVLAIDACIHDGFIAFKELDANKVRPAFLCELMMFLKSTHASRQAGAIFQNLTTSQIKEMEIPIPPSGLQDKFLAISGKATELYVEDNSSLFESLSIKAFSGQL
ncbi:MAG: restriction endonuclease subunit S [Sphingopyxis sp.]|nr:MAG: restriction endonuclease subunit S [Sphingopyxis sp.]